MSACSSCLKPKANLSCSLCNESLCKDCAHFIDESSYPFLPLFLEKINLGTQCPTCFQKNTAGVLQKYDEVFEKAQNTEVFYRKTDGKETRLMRRLEPVLTAENCADEEEVLMSLAFQAAQKGATIVVDIDVMSEKTKNGSYTTVQWKGSGSAALRPTRN
jgi:hypothetical protein